MALRKRSRVWRCRRRKQRRSLSRNDTFLPQQRKLMGSSAQNSSGVHWCRRRVRFNQVPEKVPKVPKKVWEGEVWEALVQSQVRFNRVPEKVPEKVPGSLGAKPSQVQQGSREGSGEGLGSFGAARSSRRFPEKVWEALVQSQVRLNRQGSGEGSEEGSRSLGAKPSQVQWVPEKAWEALVHSQVRFNRVLAKVPEKVWEALVPEVPEKVWEALVQSQVRFNRVPEKVPEKAPGFGAEPCSRFRRRSERFWCRARSGSTGFRSIFRRRF